jgi:hypothetical protein
MKSFKQLIEETFEDPFVAVSNIERREQGEPDVKGEWPDQEVWYAHRPRWWIDLEGRPSNVPVQFTVKQMRERQSLPQWSAVKWSTNPMPSWRSEK